MKKVLFLDFDGAAHPVNCLSSKFFCCLPLIEGVLREHAGVVVVVSSSWRIRRDLDALRAFFALDIRSRVVGTTPMIKSLGARWIDDQAPPYERQWECEEWLRQQDRPGTPWVAIDDQPELFKPWCANLLLTKPLIGFEVSQVDQLHDMLKA